MLSSARRLGVHPAVVIGKPDTVDCLLWHRWALLANWVEAEAHNRAIAAARAGQSGPAGTAPRGDTAPLSLTAGGRLPPPPPGEGGDRA